MDRTETFKQEEISGLGLDTKTDKVTDRKSQCDPDSLSLTLALLTSAQLRLHRQNTTASLLALAADSASDCQRSSGQSAAAEAPPASPVLAPARLLLQDRRPASCLLAISDPLQGRTRSLAQASSLLQELHPASCRLAITLAPDVLDNFLRRNRSSQLPPNVYAYIVSKEPNQDPDSFDS
jgi:hypothetical protein